MPGSLGELVENYRATLPPAADPAPESDDLPEGRPLKRRLRMRISSSPFSEAAYTKKQISRRRTNFG